MPNKKLDALKISRELSKRKVLTLVQRAEIRKRGLAGESQRGMAREFDVSRRLVSFIIHPDRYEKAKAQRRERYKNHYCDGRYYDKEAGTKAIADLRKRKRIMLEVGQ